MASTAFPPLQQGSKFFDQIHRNGFAVHSVGITGLTLFSVSAASGVNLTPPAMRPPYWVRKVPKTREQMAESLIRMLMDGPEVSLRGSPTVSPQTAAA